MRRTRLKRNLFAVILLALYILLSLFMFRTANEVARNYQTVSLRYDVPLTHAQANNARRYSLQNPEKSLFWPTYWAEGQAKLKSNGADMGQVRSIIFDGDAALVCPDKMLNGAWPAELDSEGCAVSSKLAWRLWGSTDGVGQVIDIDGRNAIVRGVFESEDELVVVGFGGRENPDGWQAVELAGNFEGQAKSEAEKYVQAAGLPTPQTVLNAPLFADFAGLLAVLPVIVLLLCGVVVLLRIRGLDMPKWHREVGIFAVLLVFAICLPLLLHEMPAWLVPNRWSDFSHWVTIFTGFKNGFIDFFSMKPFYKDVAVKWFLLKQLLYFSCMLILLPVLWRRFVPVRRIKNGFFGVT